MGRLAEGGVSRRGEMPWSLRKGLLSCEAVDTENLCQAQISLAYNIPFKGLGTATTLRRKFGPQENQTKKAASMYVLYYVFLYYID